MRENFGIFEPVFQSPHGYLALLHLGSDDAAQAIELVNQCCKKVPNPHGEIIHLLQDTNWRPHLVAAVALATTTYSKSCFDFLWNAFDSGSWVSPQLAVIASLRDPDFSERAQERLSSMCPVEPAQLASMSAIERHSAQGPGSIKDRSAKAAATLASLLPAYSLSSRLEQLISEDIDNGSSITQRWKIRLLDILSSDTK